MLSPKNKTELSRILCDKVIAGALANMPAFAAPLSNEAHAAFLKSIPEKPFSPASDFGLLMDRLDGQSPGPIHTEMGLESLMGSTESTDLYFEENVSRLSQTMTKMVASTVGFLKDFIEPQVGELLITIDMRARAIRGGEDIKPVAMEVVKWGMLEDPEYTNKAYLAGNTFANIWVNNQNSQSYYTNAVRDALNRMPVPEALSTDSVKALESFDVPTTVLEYFRLPGTLCLLTAKVFENRVNGPELAKAAENLKLFHADLRKAQTELKAKEADSPEARQLLRSALDRIDLANAGLLTILQTKFADNLTVGFDDNTVLVNGAGPVQTFMAKEGIGADHLTALASYIHKKNIGSGYISLAAAEHLANNAAQFVEEDTAARMAEIARDDTRALRQATKDALGNWTERVQKAGLTIKSPSYQADLMGTLMIKLGLPVVPMEELVTNYIVNALDVPFVGMAYQAIHDQFKDFVEIDKPELVKERMGVATANMLRDHIVSTYC